MSQGKRSAGEEPAIAGVGDPGVESLWRLSAAGRSRQKNAPRDRGRLAHGTCQTFTEGRGTRNDHFLYNAQRKPEYTEDFNHARRNRFALYRQTRRETK